MMSGGTMRKMARLMPKTSGATNWMAIAYMVPDNPPRAALVPKVSVLVIGTLTPFTAAPVSLSRIAMMDRPGRL